ncbi:chromo domain-containing protein [Colletotrichum musicola]|uniref:Chromo domain-containing protein n=1 Tax=Colletotrichum musicola TaxID=2175873 RepID=A0A8H6KT93_9PEZI|nr:chromo domain-containing protein [Colletotrichum musicola]
MSRHPRRVWFPRAPSDDAPTSTAASHAAKQPPERHLAVVLDDIASRRAYRPGTGPRLRPVTLIPPRDTTAYIRDEFFVPPALSHDGKKRLQYAVGWTDLPAARLVVDAERVDEYVSPLAYEEWCAARAAERDEEERRVEEEENLRLVAEAERDGFVLRNGFLTRRDTTTHEAPLESDGWEGGKRKRTHDDDDGLSSDGEEAGGKRRQPGRPRKNAPSLSTPPKALLEAFGGLDDAEADTDDTNEEEAIFRQLNGEQEQEQVEDSYDSAEESDGAPVPDGLAPYPPAKKQRTTSPAPPSIVRLPPALETDSGRSTPFLDSSRRSTSSPAPPPLPQPSHATTTTQEAHLIPGSAFLPSLPQASATQISTPSASRTASAIQLPRRSLLSVRDPPSPSPPPHIPHTQTPTPKASNHPPRPPATAPPAMNASNSYHNYNSNPPAPPSVKRWGFGFVPLPQSTTTTPRSAAIAVPKAPSLLQPHPAQLTQHHPHPNNQPQSPPNPPPRRRKMPSPTTTTTATRAQPPPRSQSPQGTNVFEVLRLEGLQIRHVLGRPARYFAVRWRGDWPPGQNPTWEPERNIPESLVGAFLLTNPVALGPVSPSRHRRAAAAAAAATGEAPWDTAFDGFAASSPPRARRRKCPSVSGAFAAVEDGGDADGEVKCKVEEVDEDEVLLITDEPRPRRPRLSW